MCGHLTKPCAYRLNCSVGPSDTAAVGVSTAPLAMDVATVAAKVRNLHDYQLRLLNNSISPPSGHDVANTLKYFSQTLLGK